MIDKYVVGLSEGAHLRGVHGKGNFVGPLDATFPVEKWNDEWKKWIDVHGNDPSLTSKDVFLFAGELMDRYGLSGLEIHPYYK